MAETMVKRVARQFCTFGNHDAKHSCCRAIHGAPKECERLARETIELMREPTEAMIKKAEADADLGGYGFSDGECSRGDAKDVWRMMVDEAIKEGL